MDDKEDGYQKMPEEEKKPGCLARHVPIITWLPKYKLECLQKDVACGLTLGLMCLSQTLAQAAIATVLPISGPYTAFVPPIVYAFLGTSRHCSVSSGSMGAILIATVLDPEMSIQDRTELATLLSLISGIAQILMGWLNLAFAVRFLSQATISGFTTGAAILIIASQMKSLFGFAVVPPAKCALAKFYVAFADWRAMNVSNFVLCIGMLLLLDVCKRLKTVAKNHEKKKRAGDNEELAEHHKMDAIGWLVVGKVAEMKEIIVIIVGSCFSFATRLEDGSTTIPVLGDIPAGLPAFKAPFGEATSKLLNGPATDIQSFIISGLMIAFTSFLTTYASNKRLAMTFQYELDASQELFALGSANVAGAFFGAFPVCGSLSRSALAGSLGSYSQVCSLVVAGIIALSLCFLAPVLFYLPLCSLASIVITSAVSLFDFQTPKELWNSSKDSFHKGGIRKDFIVWCIGFGCTVQFGALVGIGVAVTVGLGQVIAEATTPKSAKLGMVHRLGRQYRDVAHYEDAQSHDHEGILVFETRGPLCFCSAEGFHEELRSMVTVDVHAIVLCFGSVDYIDYTALSVLKDMLEHFRHDHVLFMIADAKENVQFVLKEFLCNGKNPLLDDVTLSATVHEAVDALRAQMDEETKSNRQEAISRRGTGSHLAQIRLQDQAHFDEMGHTHLAA